MVDEENAKAALIEETKVKEVDEGALPFDMNELVNYSFGFDQLKAAIEYLLN